MQREHMGNYLKYAAWEESQREFERSRSIYERGLDIDYQQPTIWLKCVLDFLLGLVWVWWTVFFGGVATSRGPISSHATSAHAATVLAACAAAA